MSDSDGKKTLGLRGGPRAGNVKQSFSHGRTKSVVVETKRKRVMVPKSGTAKPNLGKSNAGGGQTAGSGGATDAEMERRLKAVRAAQAREIEEQAERKRVEQQKVE
mgnify:FL=1